MPRLPDEYFREWAAEEEDGENGDFSATSERDRPDKAAVPLPLRDGVPLRILALVLLLALAVSFLAGRLLIFKPELAPSQGPAATATPSVIETAEKFVPHDGAVAPIAASGAFGQCLHYVDGNGAEALIDADPGTIWRCEGDGVGEAVTFTFNPAVPIVGVRIVNGNTTSPAKYREERRLLSVQWRFPDGSYLEQGLAANNSSPQEVRFPVMQTGSVTMTVTGTTEPGEASADAFSVSQVEFLTPA